MTLSSTRGFGTDGTAACPGPVRPGELENLDREMWLTRGCVGLTLCALAGFVGLAWPARSPTGL